MTVTEMLHRMTSRELAEQIAFDQLEGEETAGEAQTAPDARRQPTPAELQAKLERAFPVTE
jgi:hypothetical protein